MMIKIITILAVAVLLLSMVSLGMAILKPEQPETFSLQGKVIVNVIGDGTGSLPDGSEPSSMSGKVILNVLP